MSKVDIVQVEPFEGGGAFYGDLCADRSVRLHRTGTKRFHHRIVGDVTLDFDSLDLLASWGDHAGGVRRRTPSLS